MILLRFQDSQLFRLNHVKESPWWLIPHSKGVTTHLLSGMSHQVASHHSPPNALRSWLIDTGPDRDTRRACWIWPTLKSQHFCLGQSRFLRDMLFQPQNHRPKKGFTMPGAYGIWWFVLCLFFFYVAFHANRTPLNLQIPSDKLT